MRLPEPRSPRDPLGRFVNWARTVVRTPAGWHEPTTDQEIAEQVALAARSGRRIRVVGAGHSWSAIAAPDDLALSLDRLQGILSVDRAAGRVTVRGGTRLFQLNAELARLGLALAIVGSIAQQSIAGAIATGTHGSSLRHGNMASFVDGLRLVTGRAEVLDLGHADTRLEGARVHLGALGVVSQVTLRVEPAFRLQESVERVPLSTVSGRLVEIARSAEYAKVWWFPHTPDVLIYRYQRTTLPETTRPTFATQRWIDDVVMQGTLFPWLVAVQDRRPDWIPAINRTLLPTFVHGGRVARSDLMMSTPMPLLHREAEAAIPAEQSDEALDRIARLIDREGLHVNFPLELRFVRGDASWMSPAQGRDTCQVGAYIGGIPDEGRYLSGFWREMRAMSGRPHWGKELDHSAAEIAQLYPQHARFLALREELDPQRIFTTPLQSRLLGV